jgi:hypothetical protein
MSARLRCANQPVAEIVLKQRRRITHDHAHDAHAEAAGDGLADLTGSDENNDALYSVTR